ncbi:unnamed protein product [Timema podura]|uniref:Uncharacterized protein n=1 Tax=Timema podura TaxID=61482 RepID=A0ABN7NIF1_TIMPD|nr:unnamed protein product [Timema podura]
MACVTSSNQLVRTCHLVSVSGFVKAREFVYPSRCSRPTTWYTLATVSSKFGYSLPYSLSTSLEFLCTSPYTYTICVCSEKLYSDMLKIIEIATLLSSIDVNSGSSIDDLEVEKASASTDPAMAIPSTYTASIRKRARMNIITSSVDLALYRVKLSDRKARYLLESNAEGLGQKIGLVFLDRINEKWKGTRKNFVPPYKIPLRGPDYSDSDFQVFLVAMDNPKRQAVLIKFFSKKSKTEERRQDEQAYAMVTVEGAWFSPYVSQMAQISGILGGSSALVFHKKTNGFVTLRSIHVRSKHYNNARPGTPRVARRTAGEVAYTLEQQSIWWRALNLSQMYCLSSVICVFC